MKNSSINSESSDAEFHFDLRASNLKLPRKVTQFLRNEELCTLESLRLLQTKDLKEMGLPSTLTNGTMITNQCWIIPVHVPMTHQEQQKGIF